MINSRDVIHFSPKSNSNQQSARDREMARVCWTFACNMQNNKNGPFEFFSYMRIHLFIADSDEVQLFSVSTIQIMILRQSVFGILCGTFSDTHIVGHTMGNAHQ